MENAGEVAMNTSVKKQSEELFVMPANEIFQNLSRSHFSSCLFFFVNIPIFSSTTARLSQVLIDILLSAPNNKNFTKHVQEKAKKVSDRKPNKKKGLRAKKLQWQEQKKRKKVIERESTNT